MVPLLDKFFGHEEDAGDTFRCDPSLKDVPQDQYRVGWVVDAVESPGIPEHDFGVPGSVTVQDTFIDDM